MEHTRRLELRTYRNHRLEILDDGGDGWAIAIYAAQEPRPTVLRNHVPKGLPVLLAEAEAMVDRWIDGRPFLA